MKTNVAKGVPVYRLLAPSSNNRRVLRPDHFFEEAQNESGS